MAKPRRILSHKSFSSALLSCGTPASVEAAVVSFWDRVADSALELFEPVALPCAGELLGAAGLAAALPVGAMFVPELFVAGLLPAGELI
jgi:hypothetical protein